MLGSSILLNYLHFIVANLCVLRVPQVQASYIAVQSFCHPCPGMDMSAGCEVFEWGICDVQGVFNSTLRHCLFHSRAYQGIQKASQKNGQKS